jgi:hypothetical protein
MMPIRPENRARYPKNWKAISLHIRSERAGDRCECTGQCGDDHRRGDSSFGRCGAPNGKIVCRAVDDSGRWVLGDACFVHRFVRVILTVAHLDHQPENCADANLLAMCQYCHLRYDREHHAWTRRAMKDELSGQRSLPLDLANEET